MSKQAEKAKQIETIILSHNKSKTAKKFFEYFYLSAVICVVSYNCCCRLYFLIQQQ